LVGSSNVRRAALALVAFALVASAAVAQDTIPIAAIHANLATYTGQIVTVEGVVTVPAGYRGPGTSLYSGYVQDGSGRGLNLFGGSTSPPSALTVAGNRVRVTGEVAVFSGTTVELTNITSATLVSSGSPLAPIQLSTSAANDARWEGTSIEVSGNVDSVGPLSSGARNYFVNDGSGRTVARVYDTVGTGTFTAGQHVTARGAGTNFSGLYEFYVGLAADMAVTAPVADTAPPVLVGAWAPSGSQVLVTFGEALAAASGGTSANYTIFETANPSATLGVGSVTLAGPVATLALSGNLTAGANYSVRASNVADLANNTIPSPIETAILRVVGPVDTTPPSLTAASAPNLGSVTATFSEAIDSATGGATTNYLVFPAGSPGSPVGISSVSVAAAAATLTLASNLTAGSSYTLRAQNVQDLAGNAMPAPQEQNFTAPGGGTTTPIAEIQNNLAQYKGQTVTIQGQVYIPTNYRGTTISGYIQDGSGRGINLFGSGMDNSILQNTGNIAFVTAVVDTYYTTIELVNPTSVTLASSGNPVLQPVVLTAAAASSSQREGTYIQVTGTISAVSVAGPGTNYTISDGSGTVVVRVVDTLGAASFSVGQTITARGAGSYFSPDYEVLVGSASNVFVAGGDTTPPSVVSASTPSSLTQVNVTFSEPVTAATGGQAANYTLFETATPTITVPVTSSTLAGNRASTLLGLGSALTSGRGYTLRVVNLSDDTGNVMTAPQSVTFTAGVGPQITPIASIQNNLRQYKGQSVTVQGQVYIPSNYRGTTPSGYIQDESGRGVNVFGSSWNSPTFQNVGNIVRATAVVDTYFTTVELLNATNITLVSSGNPPLVPTVLRASAASSGAWEGTYILVTGTITAKSRPGAAPNATNYTIQDDTGTIVVRVVDTIGAADFDVGTLITARGAGGFFSPDYQLLVGESDAIFAGEPVDIFPPAVLAALTTGSQSLRVDFNEAVSLSTAEVAGNYEVFRTSQPSETIAVTAAQRSKDAQVSLSLGSPLDVRLGWTLRVRNVTDLLGNAISAAGVTHVIEEAPAEGASIDGPAYTFLPRLGEAYPITFTVPSDVTSNRGHVLVRIFDMRGRLQRTLFDSRYDGGFVNNRVTIHWDGRDERQSYVPAGAYVVHLLVSFEAGGGDTKTAQMPVVVATRLSR
jgi:Bacterial Ig-like domain